MTELSAPPAIHLEDRINTAIASTKRMALATSVDGCSSCANVFFARDGNDFIFFTFNSTRKAHQIRFNPNVQITIWPGEEEGIRDIRVEGNCFRIKQPGEISKAREKILSVTDAFREHMDDKFLNANGITGYYRVTPTRITYIDFCSDPKFEAIEFPENQRGTLIEALEAMRNRLLLWIQAVRALFLPQR